MIEAIANYQWRPRRMPTPTPQDQQGNVILALVGAIGISVGAAVGGAFNWLISRVNKASALELKQADKQGVLADDLQAELTRLTTQSIAQAGQVKELNEECRQLRKEFNVATLETVERERKISHLENEVEKLTNMVTMLKDEKVKTQQEYEAQIVSLQNELVDKQHEIDDLKRQIADFEKIGIKETPVPKRGKE